jgi:hypothetical protein
MRWSSIIGFGQYHYKSERSTQEWDRPLTGFSPRKTNMTLYVMLGLDDYRDILAKLWKYKASKWCVYFKRLADIDLNAMKELIKSSFENTKKRYNV